MNKPLLEFEGVGGVVTEVGTYTIGLNDAYDKKLFVATFWNDGQLWHLASSRDKRFCSSACNDHYEQLKKHEPMRFTFGLGQWDFARVRMNHELVLSTMYSDKTKFELVLRVALDD